MPYYGSNRHLVLVRLLVLTRILMVAVAAFGAGLFVSPVIRAQSNNSMEFGTLVEKQSEQQRQIRTLETANLKTGEQVSAMASDIALMKGVGIGLASIVMILQVIQTVASKSIVKREA